MVALGDISAEYSISTLSSKVDSGLWNDIIDGIEQYVSERHCTSGGYCFYRLNEPNASDTCFAISILRSLGRNPYDYPHHGKTIRYLQSLQNSDGTYPSVFMAYYAIKSLTLMGSMPLYDPSTYIRNGFKEAVWLRPRSLPPEVVSVFKKVYMLFDLINTLSIDLDRSSVNALWRFITAFLNADGGFGHRRSTLIETSHALGILSGIEKKDEWLEDIAEVRKRAGVFVGRCEDPIYGFVNVPGIRPGYIEDVHAGLEACTHLHRQPTYADRCLRYILGCRNSNGGFARAISGSSNLENTYHAIKALIILGGLSS